MVIWKPNNHGTGHLNNEPLGEQTNPLDLNTELASYSDSHCIEKRKTILPSVYLKFSKLHTCEKLLRGLLIKCLCNEYVVFPSSIFQRFFSVCHNFALVYKLHLQITKRHIRTKASDNMNISSLHWPIPGFIYAFLCIV